MSNTPFYIPWKKNEHAACTIIRNRVILYEIIRKIL